MSDVQQPHYRERLWPSIGVSAFCLLMIVSLGIAVDHMYGFMLGFAVTIAVSAVAVLGTVLYTVTIETRPEGLQVGNALLPWKFVGPVSQLDREATVKARSVNAHPSAFFAIRSWIPESVIVQVDDESDPHPYWHISSRNVADLVQAIELGQSMTQLGGGHNG